MTLLPLFPLPNVVLFPDALVPLHIFEPRYREMIGDTLEGDRRIGMVLLRAGWKADYEGRPPIYPIGCSAVIVHAVKLDDGRYNIVIRGLERFRVTAEDDARAYRRATIDAVPETALDDEQRAALGVLRATLEARLGLMNPAADVGRLSSGRADVLPDAQFVNQLSQSIALEPVEKQALLECGSVLSRAETLIELLEMKRAVEAMPGAADLREH
jgi:Lon protease-like protein